VSSGIGEATAKRLAAKGAKVVLGARREDHLKRTAQTIREAGGPSAYPERGVTKQEDNDRIVQLAQQSSDASTPSFSMQA
jgi:NADP-dependent 3-hydroxy acid dehydrogenase YdfG